jgi:Ca-activated chloride channel homolog
MSVINSRRPFWQNKLFQVPLMGLITCLILAALVALLGLGKPSVAVAIAIDLSGSTYDNDFQKFNSPGTILYQEVQAVKSYLDRNEQILKKPNQISIFGFGGITMPLTNNFETDSQSLKNQLDQALNNPLIAQRVVPSSTDLDLAIATTTEALSKIPDRCREILLVTDGEASVSDTVITEAKNNRVKINSIVVGSVAPELLTAALKTGGIYLPGEVNTLELLFVDKFFTRFNSNYRWLIYCLGGAWIFLMWTLVLPLDEWLIKPFTKRGNTIINRLTIFNALFWTVLTLILMTKIPNLFGIYVC